LEKRRYLMPPKNCNCHVNGFSHWKFIPLRNEYDLGIKGHFDTTAGEPCLILYVSIQIPSERLPRTVPIILSRTTWVRRKGINAVQATDELCAAAANLNSEAARVLINIAETEIPGRLQVFENSGELDQTGINVDA
jgi:hypothetical protein